MCHCLFPHLKSKLAGEKKLSMLLLLCNDLAWLLSPLLCELNQQSLKILTSLSLTHLFTHFFESVFSTYVVQLIPYFLKNDSQKIFC